jgi:hypothetical protein
MNKVDMSAQAITARLKRASQLRDLCLSLGKAKFVEPEPAKPGSKKRPASPKKRS